MSNSEWWVIYVCVLCWKSNTQNFHCVQLNFVFGKNQIFSLESTSSIVFWFNSIACIREYIYMVYCGYEMDIYMCVWYVRYIQYSAKHRRVRHKTWYSCEMLKSINVVFSSLVVPSAFIVIIPLECVFEES